MEMAVSTVSVDGSGGGDSGGDDCGGGGGDGGDGDGDGGDGRGEDGKMPAQAAEHTSSSLYVWEGVDEAWGLGGPTWLASTAQQTPVRDSAPKGTQRRQSSRPCGRPHGRELAIQAHVQHDSQDGSHAKCQPVDVHTPATTAVVVTVTAAAAGSAMARIDHRTSGLLVGGTL